jgi:CheY-like chemotaxis protein
MSDLALPPGGHALVIEDERDVLELLGAHLSRLGYRVSGAENGERGLELALAEPPDVIIVDMLLPGIDGREVVRRLRADPATRDCSILLCSVLDRADLAGVDADAVLTKPFGRAAVAQALHEGTGRRMRRGS